MKQVIQDFKSGELMLCDIPAPALGKNGVLVRTKCSVVSAGTESAMIGFAKKSLLKKALARPDLVKKVIDKIKTDGLFEAIKLTKSRLDEPKPLGYSCSGEIIEVGKNVTNIKAGDRVACYGSDNATHAEINMMPKNLVVPISDDISFEKAAFSMIGGIALQGVRCAEPRLGETVVVVGIGLLGLIGIQLLLANGCNVIGIDISEEKCRLAKELGVQNAFSVSEEDLVDKIISLSNGKGADSVIIYANSSSNDPVELASEITREKGKVIVTGNFKIEIPRKKFFEKELQFVVSRASGPGIFDEDYTEKGIDYPYSQVRWASSRNISAFLGLVEKKKIDLDAIITHRFDIEEALKAYSLFIGKNSSNTPPIGVVLTYGRDFDPKEESRVILKKEGTASKNILGLGVIGAGQFGKDVLLPAIKRTGMGKMVGISTSSGKTGNHVGKRYGFSYCTTDNSKILNDKNIDAIFILTYNNTRCSLVKEALKSGKKVYTEKPLCINKSELKEIAQVCRETGNGFFVGYNRRFSPSAKFLKEKIGPVDKDASIICRINVGFLEKENRIHDPESGGGRIVAETCHFIDLIQFLTDSVPVKVYTEPIGGTGKFMKNDNFSISLKMKNGSIASILYTASGSKSFPRERIEIFYNGKAGYIDDFREAKVAGKGRYRKSGVDRGHKDQLRHFLNSVKEGTAP